jgi:putative addiction module killer protein
MAHAIEPKTVAYYADQAGHEPFVEWLEKLDRVTHKRVLARLHRIEQGNYGDYKHIQDGVHELRLFFGPGYRIYFGEVGGKIVVLLCGGDKSTQDKDIKTALAYWKEYNNAET